MKKKILIAIIAIAVIIIVFNLTKEPIYKYLNSLFDEVAGCTGCPPAIANDSDEINDENIY